MFKLCHWWWWGGVGTKRCDSWDPSQQIQGLKCPSQPNANKNNIETCSVKLPKTFLFKSDIFRNQISWTCDFILQRHREMMVIDMAMMVMGPMMTMMKMIICKVKLRIGDSLPWQSWSPNQFVPITWTQSRATISWYLFIQQIKVTPKSAKPRRKSKWFQVL